MKSVHNYAFARAAAAQPLCGKAVKPIARGERTGKEPVTMDLRRILAATDHTQLSPTATAADIARLCAEAARHRTASVCVAPARVREAKKELERLGVLLPVCTVIGFPNGYSSTEVKACEAAAAIEDGADECNGCDCRELFVRRERGACV